MVGTVISIVGTRSRIAAGAASGKAGGGGRAGPRLARKAGRRNELGRARLASQAGKCLGAIDPVSGDRSPAAASPGERGPRETRGRVGREEVPWLEDLQTAFNRWDVIPDNRWRGFREGRRRGRWRRVGMAIVCRVGLGAGGWSSAQFMITRTSFPRRREPSADHNDATHEMTERG